MISEVEKDPWGLVFKIVTKRLVTRRKTPDLDNPDRFKYIVRSLFPHVELERAGGRLKANTAPHIVGVPNESLKEVIGAYPEILLEAFNSCLRQWKIFIDWKKQKLVLLRKSNNPLGVASSKRRLCLLDTMGKLLEELILQRLQGLLVGESGFSENQFGFRKGRSTLDAIQAEVNIATNAIKGTVKREGFCALISIDIRNAFNTAWWNICIEAMMLTPDTMVSLMLQSERNWTLIESFVTLVMKTRELDGRQERNDGEGQ